jgi:hypothetical protein
LQGWRQPAPGDPGTPLKAAATQNNVSRGTDRLSNNPFATP